VSIVHHVIILFIFRRGDRSLEFCSIFLHSPCGMGIIGGSADRFSLASSTVTVIAWHLARDGYRKMR
jgi:hypothetical protein